MNFGEGFGRLFVIALVPAAYIGVRTVIYDYFMAASNRDFDWWASWAISIPVTALCGFAAFGAISALLWIAEGFKR